MFTEATNSSKSLDFHAERRAWCHKEQVDTVRSVQIVYTPEKLPIVMNDERSIAHFLKNGQVFNVDVLLRVVIIIKCLLDILYLSFSTDDQFTATV